METQDVQKVTPQGEFVIVVPEPRPVALSSDARPTAISVLQLAVEKGASVETLSKLLELQERWEKNEARKAFDVAFAAFKSEAPRIEKTKTADFGQGKAKYKWAPLNEIADALGPALAKHGLSYNWTQTQATDGTITVTCILKHVQGHFETNSLSGPPDSSGSKNPVQAISSGTSYLRRYTVLGVTGLATSDEDTDGVTTQEASDFIAHIQDAANLQQLEQRYKEAIKDALQKQSPKAIEFYMKAREKRERELA